MNTMHPFALATEEINRRIQRLVEVRDTLVELMNEPTREPELTIGTSTVKFTPASSKPPRAKRAAGKVRQPKPKAQKRERGGTQGVLAPLITEALERFGDAWFSVDAVKEAVQELKPDIKPALLKNVCVQLIHRTDRGELQSQGTGRDRRYRVPEKRSASDDYEERKARLLG